jgi:hypothetical protein
MVKFKCDVCGCSPDSLWQFGQYDKYKGDEQEYCEPCFNRRIEFYGPLVSKEEVPQSETEIIDSLTA